MSADGARSAYVLPELLTANMWLGGQVQEIEKAFDQAIELEMRRRTPDRMSLNSSRSGRRFVLSSMCMCLFGCSCVRACAPVCACMCKRVSVCRYGVDRP